MKLDESDNLRAKDFRYEGFRQVIDGAERIPFENMLLGLVDGRQKNNRCVLRFFTFTNQRGCFEAVDTGHIDVQNDEGEIVVKEKSQSIESGSCANQVLSKVAQQRFQRNEVFNVIIDQ